MARPEQVSPYQAAFDFGQTPWAPTPVEHLRFTYALQEQVTVRSPADVGQYLLTQVYTPFDAFQQEEAWVLLLNHKYQITHQSMIYRGTLNMLHMRIPEIFKPAVHFNAAALVLSHAHPSGNPTPSPEDIAVTQTIRAAGHLLQVEVIDHVIVGRNQWWSLRDHQQGFEEAAPGSPVV